jgi:glyoxalase family protein
VHHVAWRAADAAHQSEWRDAVVKAGRNVTPVIDRYYFKSIYFREPGNVLFEVATTSPGFTADEDVATLGGDLKLPPWEEPHRADIEAALVPIRY